ncbi:MAG: quinone-dependent dihydroorotate dehydrogenase [Proteobacteria bacterium]|nr:quinone-dependent dihydroorotate dehydrogenase [Pseudomonadota bacterium]MCP4916895.1 quinone-dependent dihydroorotate dehydrogenase [Pseudomonadota bacterium]
MNPAPPVTRTCIDPAYQRSTCYRGDVLDLAYAALKPILFSMDAETAHERVLGLASSMPGLVRALTPDRRPPASLARDVAGVRFASPVGLAAGLDKNGEALAIWDRLGFGFIEIGTVTPRPQAGNPRPRVHRLVAHRAVVNSMGFPSDGMATMRAQLETTRTQGRWPSVPVGINLGKNKTTSAESAGDDYAELARELQEFADYFVVNVSSPNTPGLRDLQTVEPLRRIVRATLDEAGDVPVFVKFAPDLDDDGLTAGVEGSIAEGAQGIIATNTTRQRFGIAEAEELTGGLSGAPLKPLAHERIALALQAAGTTPVIGVGGVLGPQDATDYLELGCAAVQVYTGFIYAGPGLPHAINEALR